jgi:hypothetical protein
MLALTLHDVYCAKTVLLIVVGLLLCSHVVTGLPTHKPREYYQVEILSKQLKEVSNDFVYIYVFNFTLLNIFSY